MSRLLEQDLTREPPANFDSMVAAMLKCEQMTGQTIYQHGQSVAKHLEALIAFLKNGSQLDDWRVPTWLTQYGGSILRHLHDEETLYAYVLYHDCGKPYCLYVDETGKRHFPNHAEVSQRIWLFVGGNETVGHLISQDMVIHLASADEINTKLTSEWSCEDAVTLLLTALSELHSNARMFGGIESASFKVKWKQVDRRGKQICKALFGERAC